jgi:hypothetical protein
VREPASDQVEGGKQIVGHPGVQRQTPAAHDVQQVLGRVGQLGQFGEVEETGRPLEGVRRPEDLVDQLRVAGVPLELQQTLVDLGEQVRGLGEELGEKRIHRASPSPAVSIVATRTSRSADTGFTR